MAKRDQCEACAKSSDDGAAWVARKQYAEVNGIRMAYIDEGTGDPIVFLHGNPTSSYLWRAIMPHLEGYGRLIAPDLVGFGDSAKLPAGEGSDEKGDKENENKGGGNNDVGPYTLAQQETFVFRLLEMLGVRKKVTLVVHDWGSAVGFRWAFSHREDRTAVRGLAFMEAIAAPIDGGARSDVKESFAPLRSARGEHLILERNVFVEERLPAAILRPLPAAAAHEYRRPFRRAGEDRRPTLVFARQLPIDGEPPDVCRAVAEYSAWLSDSQIPKLFFAASPGVLIKDEEAHRIQAWPNVTTVHLDGRHFVQEDAPHEIGSAIANWLDALSSS